MSSSESTKDVSPNTSSSSGDKKALGGEEALDFSHHFHRLLIGVLGFLLPWLVIIMSMIFPVKSSSVSSILDSISAYYYTSANGFFVGTLFALAMFLFAYRGYEGEISDWVLGKIACISAIFVVIFPTEAPEESLKLSWWISWMKYTHYISAVALFLCFILFSLWLFRKTLVPPEKRLSTDEEWRGKKCRNRIYLWCGIIMIVSILWAASALWTEQAIFLPEAIAIEAFAVAWLVKGYKACIVIATTVQNWGRGTNENESGSSSSSETDS